MPYKDNDYLRQIVRLAAARPSVPLNQIEGEWFNTVEDLNDTELHVPVNTPFTEYVVIQ